MRQCAGAFLVLLLGALVSVTAPEAAASGFGLVEQSGRGLGSAFSGGSTDVTDASSLFYNPAACAWMKQNQAELAASVIDISTRFRDEGSTTASGAPLTGGDGGQGGTTNLVPNFYLVHAAADSVKVGLGVNVPFGLGTEYTESWKGRYHAVKTDMRVIDISPAASVVLVPDFLSFGAGLNVQYVDAHLTNAVDFGTILSAAGTLPQTLDGFADLKGDDWSVGYSLGLLAFATPSTRVGLSYRSKVEHTLSGDVDFDVPARARAILNAIGLNNYFTDTDARADLDTPPSVSLGLSQEIGEKTTLMGDVTWTGWSVFKQLDVRFDSGQPDSVTEERWEDSLRYALGLSHRLTEDLTLRAGTAFDETPVKTAYRTPRVPDNNRWWLALGAGYRFSESFAADFGYAHLFISAPDSRLRNKPETGYLLGYYDAAVDIFALQASYYF